MAVEVRELVIKAVVVGKDEDRAGSGESGAACDAQTKEKIIQECVHQVLKIIRRTNKR